MHEHVDVVKNEWLAGYQVLVARLSLRDGAIQIESPDVERWSQALLQPRGGIDPAEQPAEFLAALHEHLQGTYLFATPLHGEGEGCEFKESAMRALRQPAEQRHAVGA